MNKQKGRIFLAAAAFWLLPLSVQAAGMEALADVEKISTAQQVLSSFHLPGINRQSHKDKETRRREKADKKTQAQLLKAYRKYDFQQVQEWANELDPEAMCILAYAYRTGQEVEQDAEKAQLWQKRAAKINAKLAQIYESPAYTKKKLNLPRLYALAGRRAHQGLLVLESYEKAVRWSQMGAREGDTAAMAYIGSAYYTGRGLPRDDKRAIEYFQKSQHDPLSVSLLADAYKNGRGVQRNPEKGAEYATFLRMAQEKMTDKFGKGVF